MKRIMYLLMTVLVFAWGMEYIFAKHALAVMEPLTLIFFKYLIGFFVALIIKLKMDGKSLIRKKDIPIFIICAIVGQVGYFYLEYSAMNFLPVSLVTIVLAFVPVISIIIDKVFFKRKITNKLTIGILLSIVGIVLVIGVDYRILFQGRIIGYLFAFGAVIAWNIYNFMTASLHERYTSATLALNQMLCSALLILPYALTHLPAPGTVTAGVVGGILYLGGISSGIGYLIVVRALHVLGPTSTAMYSNFLPVTTTLFGWMFLQENILPAQIAGGVIVIAAGYLVIKEKGRLEKDVEGGENIV